MSKEEGVGGGRWEEEEAKHDERKERRRKKREEEAEEKGGKEAGGGGEGPAPPASSWAGHLQDLPGTAALDYSPGSRGPLRTRVLLGAAQRSAAQRSEKAPGSRRARPRSARS